MRWAGASCAVMLACAGCSLLIQPGEGDVTGGGNEADSGASTSNDASSDSPLGANDGGEGSDASTTNDGGAQPAGLLTNPGFEVAGTIGCGAGWTPDLGNAEPSAIAHSGMKGCKVCAPANGQWASMYASLPFLPGTWSAQAWFHPPDTGPALNGTRVVVAFVKGGVYADDQPGGDTLGADWQKTQATLTSTDATIQKVNVEVGGEGPNGACVIVDDVFVEHN